MVSTNSYMLLVNLKMVLVVLIDLEMILDDLKGGFKWLKV